MNDDQIKHMVDKFLSYRFPEDIRPDGGLSIRRVFNEGTPHEFKATPSGTNLLNAAQATEMVRHMLSGFPHTAGTPPPQGEGWQDIASAPKIGPRPHVLVCKGCPAYETESWREPSGDGETYDSGQYAWCNAAGRKSMGAYHYDHKAAPNWCPALPPPPGEKP